MRGLPAIDTSAVVAILWREAEADASSVAIRSQPRRVMAAPSYVECAVVMSRWEAGRVASDEWRARESIEIHPIDRALAAIAADAFVRYGKGRHPAGLNFGDCFAEALASALAAPLLFKGNDFARTDVLRSG